MAPVYGCAHLIVLLLNKLVSEIVNGQILNIEMSGVVQSIINKPGLSLKLLRR